MLENGESVRIPDFQSREVCGEMRRTVDLCGEPVILHEAMKVLARNVFSRAVVVDFEPTLLRTFYASQSAKPFWVVGVDFGQRFRSAACSFR
jgi:hypothetical protein